VCWQDYLMTLAHLQHTQGAWREADEVVQCAAALKRAGRHHLMLCDG
jgi:hypothetical protein